MKDLFTLQQKTSHSEHLFMALEEADFAPNQAQCVSPYIMQWSEACWIFDISCCLTYWNQQAKIHASDCHNLLRQVVQRTFPDFKRATLCHHPWQAILLLYTMEEKGLEGFLDIESPIGKNIYHQMSWDVWWYCARNFISHFSNQNTSKVKHNQHLRSMQKAIMRLQLPSPWLLSSLPEKSVQRRFGPLMQSLVTQAFTEAENLESCSPETIQFPWENYEISERPKRSRNLDFPLTDWNHIAPLLQEDLNFLCFLDSFKKGERIIELEWRIVLYDLSLQSIPILFRHPHYLHKDLPHQRTALLQIQYAFERELKEKFSEEDQHMAIVSWQLFIEKKLSILPQVLDIFNERDDDITALTELENQLPIRLFSYDLIHDWVPENSFISTQKPTTIGDQIKKGQAHDSIKALGKSRPLFLYTKPESLNHKGKSGLWKFSERTMNKWWLNHIGTQRDYYRYMSEKQQLWVFQDKNGKWYIHGIFG